MTQRWLLAAALTLAACGGGSVASSSAQTGAAPSPAADAEAAVQQFLEAVADSNLRRMAQLWDTARGSAARTGQPQDYERRIVVMQAYLRDRRHRLLANTQDSEDPSRRVIQVEFQRRDCTTLVPFTMIRSQGDGWIVNAIDLALLGSPGSDCEEDAGT